MRPRPARRHRIAWSLRIRNAGLVLAAIAFAAPSALAQTLGGASDDDISLWRVGGALLLCMVIAVAAAFVLRARMGGGELLSFVSKRQGRLRLVETLRLGQRSSLLIVACDGKEMLLLSNEQASQVIRDLTTQEELAKAGRPT
jgi:flagellar protein FliO/FliZ